MGGANKALNIDVKHAIGMGTRPTLKIHERWEGSIKPGRHGFIPKARTEDCIMEFLKRFAWGKKKK